MTSIRDQFPLRLIINGEDCTFEISEGFSFANSDPGGFESASFPIPRDMPQLRRGDPVRLECGLQTAWEGRVKEVQRSLGNKTLVQCEGNNAILKENTLAEIFIDRDLTKWQSPSTAQQIDLVSGGYGPSGPTVAPEPAGTPALETGFTGPWQAGGLPDCEAWYNAQGIPIYAVHYGWTKGANVNAADANWGWTLFVCTTNVGGEQDTTGSLRGAGPGSAYLTTAATNRTFAHLQLLYGAAAGTANTIYAVYWNDLAVYGLFNKTHEGRGAEAPAGFYPSDIAEYCAGKCPGVQLGIIGEATQYIVPHSAYLTPVPIEQIISDMAKFAGWHWGVWESLTYLLGNQEPRVDFRAGPAEGEPTAWCWRQECEDLDIRENIENLYDSAKVTYSEPSGEERSVEVTLDNPALDAVGLHRQVVLNLGLGTKESAEAWGLIQLRLLADQARMTGSATITEPVHEMTGAPMPAWMLRAGLDRLRISDLPCSDVWGEHNDLPITRVECTGSESGLTTAIEFGNGINLIETLAAQMQAGVTAAG